jgi:hypothetical protein
MLGKPQALARPEGLGKLMKFNGLVELSILCLGAVAARMLLQTAHSSNWCLVEAEITAHPSLPASTAYAQT